MTNEELYEYAVTAAENAYSPYSHFKVGAALLAESGKIYLGCNIENASFSATVCAERVALVKAVSEGERKFLKLAVMSPDNFCTPCGICRQMLAEFSYGMTIVFKKNNVLVEVPLESLLPDVFVL